MIVQCPSCATKFSVDQSKIDGVSNPRFHCSRCDCFFDLQGRTKRSSPKPATTAKIDRPDSSAEPHTEQLSLLPDSSARKETEVLTQPSSAPPWMRRVSLMNDVEDEPLVRASWPEPFSASTHEADLRGLLQQHESEVKANQRQLHSLEDELEKYTTAQLSIRQAGRFQPAIESQTKVISSDEPSLHRMEEPELRPLSTELDTTPFHADDLDELEIGLHEPDTRSVDSALRSEDSELRPDPLPLSQRSFGPELSVVPFPGRSTSPAPRRRKFELQEDDTEREKPARLSRFNFPALFSRSDFSPSQNPDSFKTMVTACSLPVALTLLLCTWGMNFSSTPETIVSLAGLNSQAVPKVAPSGVEVIGLKGEWVSLDDGYRVLELRGSVGNRTAKRYRQIVVEASVFDSQNNLIEKLAVPTTTGISSSINLTSLRIEDILELQSRTGISVELKPGEELPFRIVVTPKQAGGSVLGGLQQAAYFGARVQSVQVAPTL